MARLVVMMLACTVLIACGAPATPTPTATRPATLGPPPSPSPTPQPLSASDLPPSFSAVPPADYGLSVEELAQPGLEVEQVTAFEGPEGALLLAFWGRVTRQASTAGTLLDDPAALADAFLAGYTADDERPQPFTPGVGERASGFRLEGGVSVVAFEQGDWVAVLVALAPPDSALNLVEVAHTLDQRLSSR